MTTTIRTLVLLAPLMVACTPTQPVRPLPDFVEAAVEPGDRVKLITNEGETVKFEVAEVRQDAVCSSERTFLYSDIEGLYKVSDERPNYPCGGEIVLGCSIPKKIKNVETIGEIASVATGSFGFFSWHTSFSETFYDACVQHDFCYRHGHETYGHDKDACDNEFLENMQAACLAIDIPCRAAAREFHYAVKHHSKDYYQMETSTYCEYDGPQGATVAESRVEKSQAVKSANAINKYQRSLADLLRRSSPRSTELVLSALSKGTEGP